MINKYDYKINLIRSLFQELDEFWAFKDLLNVFSKKLSYCCPLELEALMDLPLVKIVRIFFIYRIK